MVMPMGTYALLMVQLMVAMMGMVTMMVRVYLYHLTLTIMQVAHIENFLT